MYGVQDSRLCGNDGDGRLYGSFGLNEGTASYEIVHGLSHQVPTITIDISASVYC